MNQLARRMQRAAERLLENESLTADLDDPAARLLLAWGVAWTQMIVEGTAGLDEAAAQEASRPQLKATRRLMRTVNRWAGNRGAMDSAADRVLLGKIYDWAITAASAPGPDTAAGADSTSAGAAASGSVDDEARERFLARAAALRGEPAVLVEGLRRETEIAIGLQQAPQDETDG